MEPELKILLATDYSEAVMNAERYALQLAKNMNAALYIVHAYQNPFNAMTDTLAYTAKAKKDAFKNAQERLEDRRAMLFRSLEINEKDISCTCIVKEGTAAEAVNKVADELEADLIIAGTHGSDGIQNLRYGTQAWEIIKKGARPVLAVPSAAMFTGFERVVFTTAYRKNEVTNLKYLVKLLGAFNPAIMLLHVINGDLSKELRLKKIDRFRSETEGRITYGKLNIFTHPDYNEEKGISDFCEEENADLLVMSERSLPAIGRVFAHDHTKRMSFRTKIPLLVLPDSYVPHRSKIPESFDLNEVFFEE